MSPIRAEDVRAHDGLEAEGEDPQSRDRGVVGAGSTGAGHVGEQILRLKPAQLLLGELSKARHAILLLGGANIAARQGFSRPLIQVVMTRRSRGGCSR